MTSFLASLNESLLNEARQYSCVMAMIGKDQCEPFKSFQKTISPHDIYEEEGEDYGIQTDYHVTVLYGIHDSSPKETFNLLKDGDEFWVELSDVTLFENEKYDVLKIDVTSGELKRLNLLVRKNIEFTSKFTDYKPHLTLAYLKKGKGKDYVSSIFRGTSVAVRELVFSPPEGKKTSVFLKEA